MNRPQTVAARATKTAVKKHMTINQPYAAQSPKVAVTNISKQNLKDVLAFRASPKASRNGKLTAKSRKDSNDSVSTSQRKFMVSTAKADVEKKEALPQEPVVAEYLDEVFDVYESLDPIGVSVK